MTGPERHQPFQWAHAWELPPVDNPTPPEAHTDALWAWLQPYLPRWEQAFLSLVAEEGLCHRLGLALDRADSLLVDVRWVDAAVMTTLNQTYRHKDTATDVLSFPVWDVAAPPPAGLPLLSLGSVVLCVPYCRGLVHPVVAASLQNDEGLLVPVWGQLLLDRLTHGHLHLLGYHHDTVAAYEAVVGWQTRVLQQLGFEGRLTV